MNLLEAAEWAMALKKAHDEGEEFARFLKVGDRFQGAGPAAVELGYERTSPAYRMFLGAALDILETKRLSTDDQGVIVEISEVTK